MSLGRPSGALPPQRTESSLGTAADVPIDAHDEVVGPQEVVGSIRFVPHVEFSSRLSLNFEPMERKVVDSTHMKIGRFNEKSQNKTAVTFKSKVVSRLHAEIWCQDGNWFIKDAKSSSGTFVNHIRLSPPGQESKATILTDGDSIQFGIDFRGGTEEVYRCVRTKVEINRVFQLANDTFNKAAHKKLRSLTMGTPTERSQVKSTQMDAVGDDSASTYTAECCICLFAIAPAQALFVAPCSHTYHFKCIRSLLVQNYPNFLCCICRKYADLEASVEVESEAWIKSQGRDVDPRTPTVETDEPIFQPLGGIVTGTTGQLGPDVVGAARATAPLITHAEAGPVGGSLGFSPTRATHLMHDLALDRQMTPTNSKGPFLIDSAVE